MTNNARRLSFAVLAAAALALPASRAAAQYAAPAAPVAPTRPAGQCPTAEDLQSSDLYGLWTATFQGSGAAPVTLLLEAHREYAGSFSGALSRDGAKSFVAGDVGDDGDFTMEESANGTNISATWTGRMASGSCGREIRGTWKSEAGGATLPFTLMRR